MRENCKDKSGNGNKYYSYVDNLKFVEFALKDTFYILKTKISKKQENTEHFQASIRSSILLLGVWAETRLKKLLYEYNALSQKYIFTDLEIKLINLQKQKIEQWKTIIELAFRKHYNIYIGEELNQDNLNNYKKYITLIKLIDEDLKPIIETRNKLAHGQWLCQLNDKGNLSQNEVFDNLKYENIISLEKKFQILQYLTKIIHDLAISKHTFTRDFEKHYKEINDRRKFLKKHKDKEYNKLIIKLQKKITSSRS